MSNWRNRPGRYLSRLDIKPCVPSTEYEPPDLSLFPGVIKQKIDSEINLSRRVMTTKQVSELSGKDIGSKMWFVSGNGDMFHGELLQVDHTSAQTTRVNFIPGAGSKKGILNIASRLSTIGLGSEPDNRYKAAMIREFARKADKDSGFFNQVFNYALEILDWDKPTDDSSSYG